MTGFVPGPDAHARAVRLAGALAELGVLTLTLSQADGSIRTLAARQTDLPALLVGTACTLRSTEFGIDIEIRPDSIMWRTADPQVAEHLTALA